jgi:hypothetical protein
MRERLTHTASQLMTRPSPLFTSVLRMVALPYAPQATHEVAQQFASEEGKGSNRSNATKVASERVLHLRDTPHRILIVKLVYRELHPTTTQERVAGHGGKFVWRMRNVGERIGATDAIGQFMDNAWTRPCRRNARLSTKTGFASQSEFPASMRPSSVQGLHAWQQGTGVRTAARQVPPIVVRQHSEGRRARVRSLLDACSGVFHRRAHGGERGKLRARTWRVVERASGRFDLVG